MALARSLNNSEIAKLVYGSNWKSKRWTPASIKRDLNNTLKETNYIIKTSAGLPDMKVYKVGNNYYTYLGSNVAGQTPMVNLITDTDTLNYLKDNPTAAKGTIVGELGNDGYKFGYTPTAPTIVNQFTSSDGKVTTTYSDGTVTVDTSNVKNNKSNSNTTTETKTSGSGSGSNYNPYIEELENKLNSQNSAIEELQKKLDEANRVYTGEELAEHYGITDTLFSRDYWKNLYTDYVNEMYDDLIRQQDEYRNRFARNNATYDDYLEKEYMNSYNNASNARTTRGAIAANALSTGNVNDYNSSKNDISMLQNIYGYEALRQAGLADVANRAEQAANNNRAVLMQLGAKHNTSDVTAATNALNAASTIYSADKNYLTGLANAAKAKYGGLVNAASSNANSSYQQMYNYYMGLYNNDNATASSYLSGLLEGKTGGNS